MALQLPAHACLLLRLTDLVPECAFQGGACPAPPAQRQDHALAALLQQERQSAVQGEGGERHAEPALRVLDGRVTGGLVHAGEREPAGVGEQQEPESGSPVTDTPAMTSINGVSVRRKMLSGRLRAPGGPCITFSEVASHTALSRTGTAPRHRPGRRMHVGPAAAWHSAATSW